MDFEAAQKNPRISGLSCFHNVWFKMSHMKYGFIRTSARRPDDGPTTCRTETRPVPEDKGLSGATAYCIRSGATGKLATKRRWLLSDSIGSNALLTRTAGVTRSGSWLKARHGPPGRTRA